MKRSLTKAEVESGLTALARRRAFEALGIDTKGRAPDSNGWIARLRLPAALKSDRNASVSVNLKTGAWNDFGSHYKGDLYTLHELVRGGGFRAALAFVDAYAQGGIR